MPTYPWYEILSKEDGLQQGDLIPSCPIVVPPAKIVEGDTLDVRVDLIDSIVLSQSCDLVNGKAEIVLVCPYYSLKTFLAGFPAEQIKGKGQSKIIDNLRKGFFPSYHLLNNDGGIDPLADYQVVDFRNVYGIQYTALINIIQNIEPRIRLLPPYREHLSQGFARYFMRVGLPQDIKVEGY
jgi:hypothetical protein